MSALTSTFPTTVKYRENIHDGHADARYREASVGTLVKNRPPYTEAQAMASKQRVASSLKYPRARPARSG